MADEQDGYVPKEFNDANIRVAREFKAQRDALVKVLTEILETDANGYAIARMAYDLRKRAQETIDAVSSPRDTEVKEPRTGAGSLD